LAQRPKKDYHLNNTRCDYVKTVSCYQHRYVQNGQGTQAASRPTGRTTGDSFTVGEATAA